MARRKSKIVIQVDSREKQHVIERILDYFDEHNIQTVISKLPVGDYMMWGYPDVVIDRKHGLGELAGNICGKQHARFSNELQLAYSIGTHVVVLVEDDRVSCFEDVKRWSSPHTKVKGETLYKAMKTMESKTEKYDVEFQFCRVEDTGRRIEEILVENAFNDDDFTEPLF